jgi:hypothetical protein
MRKKNRHPTKIENAADITNIENSQESIKLIKRLELQRVVLNKILDRNINPWVLADELDNDSTKPINN